MKVIILLPVFWQIVHIQAKWLPNCNTKISVDSQIQGCNSSGSLEQVKCSSLSYAFELINTVISKNSGRDNCTTITLTDSDVLNISLNISSSIFLQRSEMKAVNVYLHSSTELVSLSFNNANFIAIDGIDFVGYHSEAISFDTVVKVHITHSSFR